MSPQPIVVKLGGDALATPARIAAQARRLARWAEAGPVVAVASARRGVTDHLLGLVGEIEAVTGDEAATSGAHLEADRAVSSGEVVSAALLALALNRLGWHAVSLDAREAGILARGPRGDGRIRRIQAQRIRQLYEKGIIPVITGFQGWQDGRVVTLGRGGSDTSAVALADALGASKVVFVKDAAGLRTADPKLVPDTEAIPEAPHAFLTALTRAGAKVVHAHAAALAEARGLPLEFWTLDGEAPASVVRHGVLPTVPLLAAAASAAHGETADVTVLGVQTDARSRVGARLEQELRASGVSEPALTELPEGIRVTVPAALAGEALRIAHRVAGQAGRPVVIPTRLAS